MKKLLLLLVLPMALNGATQELRQDTGTHKIIKPPASVGALYDMDFSDVTTNISGGGGGGTPGGSNTQFQYNNSLTFGGIPYTTYDGSAVTQMAGARYNLADTTDITKKARIDVSLVATGTTRIVTVAPSANSVTVVPSTATTNNFLTGISSVGVLSSAQPAFSNISGTITLGQTSMASGFMLGRSTTSQGPFEQITVGTGLTLAGGTLSSSAISTPGGTDTQFQFNDAGVFAGTPYLTYNTGIGRIFEQTGTRLRFTDNADTTKQMAIDMTGVTGGLTQTFKIPNANFVGVIGDTGAANSFLTAISPTTGVISKAQPSFTNLSGSLALSQTSMTDGKLLGRNTGAGTGIFQEITLGTNLSFTGTTLNASGGSATPGGSDTQLQYNNAGSLGGISTWTTSGVGTIVTASAPSLVIADAGDPTKKMNFSTSLLTPGVTRSVVVAAGSNPVIPAADSGTANNFLTGIDTAGVIGKAQPAFSNLSGTLSLSQTSMSTARLLGRSTLGTGVVEQISIGSNLTLAAGTLSASGGGTPGGSTTQLQYNNAGVFGGDASLTTDGTSTFLRSTSTFVQDAVDPTKQINFALGNMPTATLNSVVVPAGSNPVIVAADAGASNNFLTGITTLGVVTKAQPAFSNLSGVISMAQNKVLIGKELFVDATNGVDATGARGDLTKPFLTITVALSWASAGDVVYVGPGTYAQGTTPLVIPAGVTVVGAGAEYTLITSAVTRASNRASVEGGTGGALSNVTINNSAASGIPFGNGSSSSAFTLFSISGVKLIGLSDGVSLSKAGTTGLQAENLYITTQGQCIEAAIGSSTFRASDLIADGTATALARAIRVTNGTVIFRDGAITAGNSTTTNVAVSATGSGSRVELHNVSIDRNATGVTNLDFEQASSAFLGIDNALRTDSFPPAMSGDITQIDRWDVKVTPIVSSATWSPVTTNSDDIFKVTAQAVAATTIDNPVGTPADGQKLIFEIKDDGTSRALTWSGTQWRAAGGLTLPAATTTGRWNYYGFVWNASDSKWDFIGSANPVLSGTGTVTSVGLAGTANQITITGSSPIIASGNWTASIPALAQLSIAKNTNLTTNGFVTTSGGDGTLSVDTGTYIPNVTPGTSGNVLTSNGSSWTSAAAAGGGTVSVGATLFVDATNGNNGTAIRGRADKPYLTISAANTAASVGDTIKVGPGTFTENSGVKLKANINLVGDGIGITTIQSTLDSGSTSNCIINPGNNDVISDLSITGNAVAGTTQLPIGASANDNVFTNVFLFRIKTIAETDGLFLTKAGTLSVTAYDSIFTSNVDSVRAGTSGNSIDLFNCELVADGPIAGSPAHGISNSSGTVRMFGGTIVCTDGNTSTYSVHMTGGTTEVHDVRIETSSAGTVADLHQTGGSLKVANAVRADGTALTTSGTITYMDNSYVDNTAYASSWNGVTTVAPSKNAIYDELHLFDTADNGTILDAGTGFRVAGAAASGKILKGNGTNFVASTETYAAPGTTGNVLTSDGTNWTSAAPTGSVSDTAYDSTTWNAVTTIAPSKNALRDYFVLFDSDGDGKVDVLDQAAGIANTNSSGVIQTPLTAPSGAIVGTTDTQTLTNKRVTKRSLALSAPTPAPTISADSYDVVHITGLSGAITSITMTGTPVEGDMLRIDFTDNGTARAIALGSSFEDGAAALPTTTVISTRLDTAFYWNTVTSKWRCMAVGATDVVNATTGFRIGGAAGSGKLLQGNGTNFVASTATWPTTNTVGYLIRGDGTNYAAYPSEQINSSVSSQTPSTSDVYITGSNVTVAAGDFKAKGQYRCSFDLVKSAGTGTAAIAVRIGTAASTSDTSRITLTFPGAGTSVADTGTVDVVVNWRTVGSGTTAVVSGYCKLNKNVVTAAGLWNTAVGSATVVGSVSGGFDSSAATNIGLSFNGGTAFAGTITTVQAQLTQ